MAFLFNYASMAHNNQLFFEGLALATRRLEDYKSLHDSLVKTFGSIETLKDTMLETAAAMFGPGFVWLVWSRGQYQAPETVGWRILTTYLAGTPYAEASQRAQDKDMNTEPAVQNTVGSFGPNSLSGRKERRTGLGGTLVEPMLCVNTWEHVYMTDYGFDKRAYLEAWWKSIDWEKVDSIAPFEIKGGQRKMAYSRLTI